MTPRLLNVVLGVWVVVAPLVLRPFVDYPTAATVNAVSCGVAVAAIALVPGRVTDRFGGGWRSVWRSDVDTVTGSTTPDEPSS